MLGPNRTSPRQATRWRPRRHSPHPFKPLSPVAADAAPPLHQPARGAPGVCDAAPRVVSPFRAGVSNPESRPNPEMPCDASRHAAGRADQRIVVFVCPHRHSAASGPSFRRRRLSFRHRRVGARARAKSSCPPPPSLLHLPHPRGQPHDSHPVRSMD